jgi:hypothetical protein
MEQIISEVRKVRKSVKKLKRMGLIEENKEPSERLVVPPAMQNAYGSLCMEIDGLYEKVESAAKSRGIELKKDIESVVVEEEVKVGPLQEPHAFHPFSLMRDLGKCSICGGCARLLCPSCGVRFCVICHFSAIHRCEKKT